MKANGEEGLWVIRWSSPWVESFDIYADGNTAIITYYYTDSTGERHTGEETVKTGEKNGKTVVVEAVLSDKMKKMETNQNQ